MGNQEKKIYTLSELVKMGYRKNFLYNAAHCSIADKYCFRTSRNGTFQFDLPKFEKMLPEICKILG